MVAGSKIPIDCPEVELKDTIPTLVKRAGRKPALFFGWLSPDGSTFWPVFGYSSVWPSPRDIPDPSPETLEGCIAFVTATLKISPLPPPVTDPVAKQNSTSEEPMSSTTMSSSYNYFMPVLIAAALVLVWLGLLKGKGSRGRGQEYGKGPGEES